MSRKKLGRGLDALLGGDNRAVPVENTSVEGDGQLALDQLFRGQYQPRRKFDDAALNELAASIKAQGVMQPVLVRPRPQGGYELVAGERRWRAAQIAGLQKIPAIVRTLSDEQASAMALIENMQREDLNPLEEAQGLERLRTDFNLTQQQIADAVGKSRVAVANLLRLLNLAPAVRTMLLESQLEMGHARALLSLESFDQERLAHEVVNRGLSVRQIEALVRRLQNPQPERVEITADPDTARLERRLTDHLGAPVSIRQEKSGKGQVVIRYNDLDELDGILAHFKSKP
ncbi:MAG: ParB/RepB/Spo0J family partition protein [Proteobacteria bacterium]|nr:ParB/RepB/Spo0J family partition protein [Pseudomonadota bacterium]